MTVYRIKFIEYNIKENGEQVFNKSWIGNNIYSSRAVAEHYCVESNFENPSRHFEYEIISQEVIEQ